jgi:hypothetical protein
MNDAKLTSGQFGAGRLDGWGPLNLPKGQLEVTLVREPSIEIAPRRHVVTADFCQDLDMAVTRARAALARVSDEPSLRQKLFFALDGKSVNEREPEDHIAMLDSLLSLVTEQANGTRANRTDTFGTPIQYWPAIALQGRGMIDYPDQIPRECVCAISHDLTGVAFSADLGFREVFVVAQIGLLTVFSLDVQNKGVEFNQDGAVTRLCDAFGCGDLDFSLDGWPERATIVRNSWPIDAYVAARVG